MVLKTIFQESNLYTMPVDAATYDKYYIFTLDEFGNLKKVEDKISSKYLNTKTTEMKLMSFMNDEFTFIPAYLNGKPVPSKIIIKAKLTTN